MFLVFSFAVNPSEIKATDDFNCNFENIFLFEYDHIIWYNYIQIIESVACDIDTYWREVEATWLEYQSPNYVVQEYADYPYVTPDTFTHRTPNGACNVRPNTVNLSAYYCRDHSGIVFSEPLRFMHYLAWEENGFGELNIAYVLAHEWVHHIQHISSSNLILVDRELQAECLAGAYLNFAINNHPLVHIDLSLEDWTALQEVIPGNVPEDLMVSDSGAWAGVSVLERSNALTLGFEEGADICMSNS